MNLPTPLEGWSITNRQRAIVKAAADTSISATAKEYGVSYGRVRDLVRLVAQREEGLAITVEEEKLPIEQRRIQFTTMPTRARNALTRAGYKTCGDVMGAPAAEVLAIYNLAKVTLCEIEAYLGVTLSGDRIIPSPKVWSDARVR